MNTIYNIPLSAPFYKTLHNFIFDQCHNKQRTNIIVILESQVMVSEMIQYLKHKDSGRYQIFTYQNIQHYMHFFSNNNDIHNHHRNTDETLVSDVQAIAIINKWITQTLSNNENENKDLIHYLRSHSIGFLQINLLYAMKEYYKYNIKSDTLDILVPLNNILLNLLQYWNNYKLNNGSKPILYNQKLCQNVSFLSKNMQKNAQNIQVFVVLPLCNTPSSDIILASLYQRISPNLSIISHAPSSVTTHPDIRYPYNSYYHIARSMHICGSEHRIKDIVQPTELEIISSSIIHHTPYIRDVRQYTPNHKKELIHIEYQDQFSELSAVIKMICAFPANEISKRRYCIATHNKTDCNIVYRSICDELSILKIDHNDLVSNSTPYSLMDSKYIALLLQITQTAPYQQDYIIKIIELLQDKSSYAYSHYNEAIAWFYINYLVIHPQQTLDSKINKALTSLEKALDGEDSDDHEYDSIHNNRMLFLEHLSELHMRFTELCDYAKQSNHHPSDILGMQLSILQHITGNDDHIKSDSVEKLTKIIEQDLDNIEKSFTYDEYCNLLYHIVTNKEYYHDISNKMITVCTLSEARYGHFDTIILYNMNEEVFPKKFVNNHKYLNKETKMKSGYYLHHDDHAHIGVSANHFLYFMNANIPQVIITSNQSGQKTRWLNAILQHQAMHAPIITSQSHATTIQEEIHSTNNTQQPTNKAAVSIASPNVAHRPKILTAGSFAKLLNDPYLYYLEYILNIKPHKSLHYQQITNQLYPIARKVLNILCRNNAINATTELYNIAFHNAMKESISSLAINTNHPALQIWSSKLDQIRNNLHNTCKNISMDYSKNTAIYNLDKNYNIQLQCKADIIQTEGAHASDNKEYYTFFTLHTPTSNKDIQYGKNIYQIIKSFLIHQNKSHSPESTKDHASIYAQYIQINKKKSNKKVVECSSNTIQNELNKITDLFYKESHDYVSFNNTKQKDYKHLLRQD